MQGARNRRFHVRFKMIFVWFHGTVSELIINHGYLFKHIATHILRFRNNNNNTRQAEQ
jgi:hypothetical protein